MADLKSIESKYMSMWRTARDEEAVLDCITDQIINMQFYGLSKEEAINIILSLVYEYPHQKDIIQQVIEELEIIKED